MSEIVYPIRITKEIKEKLYLLRDQKQDEIGMKVSMGEFVRFVLNDYIKNREVEPW